MVEHRTFGQGDQGSKPPAAISKLRQFHSPTLPVSFRRDTESCWSFLAGVYARGSKRSYTEEMEQTSHGLANSRDTLK